MEKTQSQAASIGTLGNDGLREVEQRLESKSVYWVNVDDRETALAWRLCWIWMPTARLGW